MGPRTAPGREREAVPEPPAPRPRQIMVARLVASPQRRPDGTGLCCVFEDSILQVSNILPFPRPRAKVNDLNARRRTVNSQPSRRRPKSPKREGGRSPPL